MRQIYIFLVFVLGHLMSQAQPFAWVASDPVNYNMNFELPVHLLCASDQGQVYSARTATGSLYYSPDLYGTFILEARTSVGQLLWSKTFGQMMIFTHLATDANGNVFAAGSYMDSLQGPDSTLANTGTGLDLNIFLLSYDAGGNLRWIRNKTQSATLGERIDALTTDQHGRPWYVRHEWNTATITCVDSAGSDSQQIPVLGSRSIGAIDFDQNGNLFISGSTQNGSLNIAGTQVSVPEIYMMFLARIAAAGNNSWIRIAHDVTFQNPVVAAGNDGHAWLCGFLMDSLSWGSQYFPQPQWANDFFLTRCDSLGNFSLAVHVPHSPVITGDFGPGRKLCIDNDSADHVYLLGETRGFIQWANNVVSGNGPPTNHELTILSFDPAGNLRWSAGGAQNAVANAFSVDVTPNGSCFFSGSLLGPALFGSAILNGNGGQASVFGRLDPGISTSVQTPGQDQPFEVYPNPASGEIFVDPSGIFEGSVYSISDLAGKLLDIGILYNNRIDVSRVEPGLYVLALKQGNNMSYRKFIVK